MSRSYGHPRGLLGPASNRRDENAQNEVLDAPAERAAPVA